MTIISKLIVTPLAAALCSGVFAQTAPEQPSSASVPIERPMASLTPLDRIVAVVNNDVITEYELQNRVHQAALNLRQQNIALPPMEQLRAQVLDRLITDKAMEQRATELGIRVDEQMVTASIEQIARHNKLTLEELRERLASDGVNYPAFRTQVRDEIVAQRLREREVDSKITIPESEVDAYLAEKAGFTTGQTTEYHVQHILLPFTSENERDVRREAERLASEARKGEDFSKLAVAHSKASDALEGGDLGWRDASRLPSSFWEAIEKNTKAGFVTTSRTSGAYHVIKLVAERDGVQAKLAGAPVDQTHVRHILMFVSDLTPEAQVIERLNDIKHRIQKGEGDFATFARLNSVDATATRGGDLGWVEAGEFVPEFEKAMNALQPGEISDPVRTQYGYHLIEVQERRKGTTDARRARLEARQALREKKLNEAVYNWQRELHDRAYVDIRKAL